MNAWICLIKLVIFGALLNSKVLAGEYHIPVNGDDVVGRNYIITVKDGDSLTSIRQKHGISYEELLDANPNINFYRLKVGQKIFISKEFILPPYRKGIVINIPELRLYYFTPDGKYVHTFPVGLGRKDWRTPMLSTKVVRKQANPVWYVPNSIREYVLNKTGEVLPDAVYPGPKNPLGKYALYLATNSYLIHGTNVPTSVGTFISSGCMRLLRDPIETLYKEVPIGTPVHIIHHPYKAGWRGNKLYFEAHKPVFSYTKQPVSDLNEISAQETVYDATHLRPAIINWNMVSKNVREHLGIPEPIGYSSGSIR